MQLRDSFRHGLHLSNMMMNMFLGDMSDEDILVRPVPGANHIAWQLGHLLINENNSIKLLGATPVELPAGFEAQHTKESAATDTGFLPKRGYLELAAKVRMTLLNAIDAAPDSKFDEPLTGMLAMLAPNLGALMVLLAIHESNHAGQFSVVRLSLKKKVMF